jgi:uncharacterized membrane protein YhiD involved in acid resistance
MTTAASLLFATAVGICAALSQELLAVLITFTVLAVLKILGLVERRGFSDPRESDEGDASTQSHQPSLFR